MKKLHSFAFYALAAPALTLCSSAVLADGSVSEDMDHEQQSFQHDESKSDHARAQNLGYMSSAPANGMHASNLIGAEVTTTDGEDVGSVKDLIVDNDGQIVAIVVGVGGYLGLGDKDVAIGWDDVNRSGTSDEVELRIDQTREALTSAPNFESQE